MLYMWRWPRFAFLSRGHLTKLVTAGMYCMPSQCSSVPVSSSQGYEYEAVTADIGSPV